MFEKTDEMFCWPPYKLTLSGTVLLEQTDFKRKRQISTARNSCRGFTERPRQWTACSQTRPDNDPTCRRGTANNGRHSLEDPASGCEDTACPTNLPPPQPRTLGKALSAFLQVNSHHRGPPFAGRGGWGAQEEPRRPPSPRGWAESGSLRPPQSHQVRREKPGVPLPTSKIKEPVCLLHDKVFKDVGNAGSPGESPSATASPRKQAHPVLFLVFRHRKPGAGSDATEWRTWCSVTRERGALRGARGWCLGQTRM